MYNGREKRQYDRVEKPFQVSFRVIPLVAKRTITADWDTVTIQDIGAGGAHFFYNEDLEIGELLDLKIGYPIITPKIHCVGKVVRVEETQSPFPFSISVEFTSIDIMEKEMIKKAVENLIEVGHS